MEQIKSFVTGKSTVANNMALFFSIGAAAYYQYSEQKKESMLEEGESLPKSNKKYILWGIVAAFMIPIVINALTGDVKDVFEIEAEPSSSFETSVSEAADALRSRNVKTETEDFRTRVSEAARKLREQIAESRTENSVSEAAKKLREQIEESSSETVEELKTTELAEKASDEIRKFLAQNS